jgi:HSP20 family protein
MNSSWLPTRKHAFENFLAPLERIFEDFPLDRPVGDFGSSDLHVAANVEENDKGFLITIDVPGIERKDINIEARDDSLYVTGERKKLESMDKGKLHYRETVYGTFTKGFRLGSNADFDKIDAELKDGVLHLQVGKKTEAMPRKISIK